MAIEVADVVRLHPLQQLADAVRFQLEHALGVAALEQRVRLGVVQRQVVQVDLDAARLLDQLDGVVEHRQRAQAEEVHLEQADLFQVAHDPLRGDGRLAAAAALLALAHRPLDRDVIGDRPVGDDDAGRVVPALRLVPSSFCGDVDQLADQRIGLVLLA